MRIMICAFMKRENDYIDEWLKHHISIGVDKFVLIDNNAKYEDYPMTEYVSRQVMSKKVKIINKRNTILDKPAEMMSIYKKFNDDFICFLDIDEFIHVRDGYDLKTVLSDEKFSVYGNIVMGSKVFGDCNNTYCDNNHNVTERFNKVCLKSNKYTATYLAFIRPHLNASSITKSGAIGNDIKSVSTIGNEIDIFMPYISFIEQCPIEIHSYPTKSLEEYCTVKVRRNTRYDADKIDDYKNKYFSVNSRTAEKEALFDSFINKAYNSDESNSGMHSYAEFNIGNGQSNNAN